MAKSFEDDEGDKKKHQQKKPMPKTCGDEVEGARGGQEVEELPPPLPPPEIIQEVADEGRHLYLDFVRTEITRNGLTEPCLDAADGAISPQRLVQWIQAGQELRQLADAFSRSSERDVVRRKAECVPIDTLDADHFLHLLQELFQGGAITRERIIVLFFFCADVSIQALRQGLHRTFHRLLDWSLKYIATQVAAWVHSSGGWGVVLRSSLDIVRQICACSAMIAVVAACVVYIRRNL